jgi:hypothetical protein
MYNGLEQKATMDYVKVHDYYHCSWCGTETWVGQNKRGITTKDALDSLKDEQRRQNQMRKKTSSRKAGKKRKYPVKIYTRWISEN